MPTLAYHEAGHGLVATLLGARVQLLTLEPQDDAPDGLAREGDSHIEWPMAEMSLSDLSERSLLVALAGPAAEVLYTGEERNPALVPEWAADWREALAQVSNLVYASPQHRTLYLQERWAQVSQLLSDERHWAALAALATELDAHESLEHNQVEEILAVWL